MDRKTRAVSRAKDILLDVYAHSGYRLVLLLALLFVVSLSEGISMVLLYPVLEIVGLGPVTTQGAVNTTFATLLSYADIKPTLASASLILICAVLIQNFFFIAQNWVLTDVQKKYVAAWQQKLFSGFIRAEWPYLASAKMGEIMNLISTEAVRLGAAFFAILQLIVAASITCVYLVIALSVSWKLTLYILAVALLLFALVRPIRRATRRFGAEFGEISSAVWSTLSEMLVGAKYIKAAAGEDKADALIIEQLNRLRRNATWSAFLPTTNRSCFEFAGILMVLGALIYGLQIEQISAAQLLVLIALVARIFPRLINIQQFQNNFNLFSPAHAILNERLRRFANHRERPRLGQITNVDELLPAEICGRDIVTSYGTKTVLDNVSFAIPAGQIVGFVGPSGAGKSTLLDLLIGLIEPTAGCVSVGNIPLHKIDLVAWRKKIGYVAQDTFLFHDTIANNIGWNAPSASSQEILAAARDAGLDQLLSNTPLGYQTVVGDRGAKISGGQRQRIGIARALVRRPALLLLDEATSALDSLSERELMSVIQQLRGKMTIVIVTHRLSMVRDADLIHVLDHGRIIEQGSWASLTAHTTLFQRLMDAQTISSD